ncbi:lycopene cyclase family protein [Synechococcus sp. RSCCF101]|nr:lycopene cyclase family protein [Synechococcus sp. RSCCF101]
MIGSGPSALAIAAELADRGLQVHGLSLRAPQDPWPNTYGIWGDEVDALGLAPLLSHRWQATSSVFEEEPLAHRRDYGLLDRTALQRFWLERCERAAMGWTLGEAVAVQHDSRSSTVVLADGQRLAARLVIDASGHQARFIRRPPQAAIAQQAAYGIVGRFASEPVEPGSFTLMDFRSGHLSEEERRSGAPTFLYAMDLGEGRFFVEETSLALAPPVSMERLERRLRQRLAARGAEPVAIEHVERCLFPMNLTLPLLDQPVLGFGSSASMVHPASGYLVGALLRRAPGLAEALAVALKADDRSPAELAAAGWQALWPADLVRRHQIHQFGLEKLMRFEESRLRRFFGSFFRLPQPQWSGFLANTLSTPELVAAMLRLFASTSWDVRRGLLEFRGPEAALLLGALQARQAAVPAAPEPRPQG